MKRLFPLIIFLNFILTVTILSQTNETLRPHLTISVGGGGKSISFEPNGKLVAACDEKTARVWDVRTGLELRSFVGHKDMIVSVLFGKDGYTLITGSEDGTIHFWSIETGKILRTIQSGSRKDLALSALALSNDGKVLASANGGDGFDSVNAIKLWDTNSSDLIKAIETPESSPRALAFNPNGEQLAVGFYSNNGLKIFNTKTGNLSREIEAHEKKKESNGIEYGINTVEFSPDGKFIASGGDDGTVKVWNAKTGASVYTFKHTTVVESVVFSPDGKLLASANANLGSALSAGLFNNYIKLWSLETGKEIRELEAGSSEGLAFSPDGKLLASDGITLRDITTGKIVRTIKGAAKRLNDMAFSSDGRTLFVGGNDDSNALFLDWKNLKLTTSPIKTNNLHGLEFSSDFKFAVQASDYEEEFYLSNAMTGKLIHVFNKLSTQVGITPDGKTVAGLEENKLTIWDVANKKEKFNISLGDTNICEIGFSPQSKFMFTKCPQKDKSGELINLIDLSTGKVFHTINNNTSLIYPVFSADEQMFAYQTQQGVKVISVKSGKTVFTIENASSLITTITFSPDSRLLATTGWGTRIYDALTGGKELKALIIPDNYVYDAAFNSHSDVIATAGNDKTITLWSISMGEVLQTLAGHNAEVDRVIFNKDDSVLASMGRDASVKFWSTENGKELVSFVFTETDGFLAITTDNYYMATREAVRSASFNVGKKVFSFEQFDLKYNRPDVVLERLGNKDQKLIAGYKRSYEKRLRRMGFTNEMLKDDFQLPEIAITTKEIPATTKSDTFNFNIRANDTKSILDRLNVFINGVPVYGSGGLSLRGKKTQTYEQNISLQLSRGRNRVEVSAMSESGTESLRESFEITYDAPETKHDLYILAVGVSDYKTEKYKLKYAAKDAEDLTTLFKANGDIYANVFVRKILNDDATRENIIAAKEWLKKAKIDDEILVFVSGHGLRDEKLDYYYGTVDIDFSNPSERGLSYDDLENLLDGIPARRKLLLMDTCFAGEVEKEDVTAKTESNNEAEKVVTNTFQKGSELLQTKKEETSTALDNLFSELRRGSGALVIAASGGAEFALESSRWKNGVFTYTIKNGLEFALADSNRDGVVGVAELSNYVSKEVERLTNGSQRPTVRRDNFEFDFTLAKQSKLIRSIKQNGAIFSLAVSSDGKTLATTSRDETVRLWSLTDGTQKKLLQEYTPILTDIAFQQDGQVVYASDGKRLAVWNPAKSKPDSLPASKISNLSQGEINKKDKYVTNEINSFVLSPDGKRMASGGEDKKVFIFNRQTQKQEIALSGHTAWIISAAWSADGRFVASGDESGIIKIWNAGNWSEIKSIKAHIKTVSQIAFSADGKLLASTGRDGAIILWDTQTGEKIRRLSFNGTKETLSRCLTFSPDGKLLATGHDDGILRLWDTQTGELVDAIAAHNGVINSLAFTPDSKAITTGGGDSSIKLWRVNINNNH